MPKKRPRAIVGSASPHGTARLRKQVTIREVAAAVGLSAMTISRTLTGRGYVAPDTARTVRSALKRLRYRPNAPARLLRGRETRLIGVTLPSLASAVHRGIVTGLEDVVGAAEYQLLLGHRRTGRWRTSDLIAAVQQQQCDGYAIIPSRTDARKTARLQLDRPAVVTLAAFPGVDADRVLVDGFEASCQATRYLLENFGAPVALINTVSRLSHDLSILKGYRHALRDAGEETHLLLLHPETEDCRARIRALLTSPRPPRAMLLASSLVAFEGLGELARLERALGRDVGVAVVATEERPWAALLPIVPPLLVIPAREVGRRAGDLLLHRLRMGDSSERRTETLAIEFQP